MPETPLLLGRLLAARRHVPNVATLESAKLFSLQELNATPNRPDMLRRFERNNVLVGNDESSAFTAPITAPPDNRSFILKTSRTDNEIYHLKEGSSGNFWDYPKRFSRNREG